MPLNRFPHVAEWYRRDVLTRLMTEIAPLARSTMKVWTHFTLVVVISSSLLAAETPAARKPNVVFILADDK